MNYTIKITDDFTLEVYKDEESKPFFIQPNWPNGQPWESKEQIQSWADSWLKATLDKNTEMLPGPGPDMPLVARPKTDPETGWPIEQEPTDTEA